MSLRPAWAIQQDSVFRNRERVEEGWKYSSLVEHLTSTVKAGGLVLNTSKTTNT